MSLRDTLLAGVATIDKITREGGLQCTVQFRHYVYADAEGAKYYTPDMDQPAASLLALVDWRQRQVRTVTGVLAVSRSVVTFLDVAALSAATGGEGLSEEDIIILPDGTTGPVLDMSGFVDSGTGRPFATDVWLG